MKLINLSLIASIVLFSCSSCNRKLAKDKNTTNAVTLQGTPSDTMSPGAGPAGETNDNTGTGKNMENDNGNRTGNDTYDLVISFYSIGAGIDNEAKESYDKLLGEYKGKINAEPTHWGREGEVDYCLKLSDLPEEEKKSFIDKSRQILEKSKLVHIKENAPCVHKK